MPKDDFCSFQIFTTFNDSDGNQYRIEITEDEYEALKFVSSYQQMSLIVDIWNRMNKKPERSEFGEGFVEDYKEVIKRKTKYE